MPEHHFTSLVPGIKTAVREGDLDSAVALLLRAIDAVEAEAAAKGPQWPIAPWYYERLAIVYRKLKMPSREIAVLERYVLAHRGRLEAPYSQLLARLEKAKQTYP